ncbi:tetratricopeptide repeat protein [Ferrovibrio sp.]|uniref:tetratricopeptide repeat protein n=1 Tax=Ferrovibrio sp. TaxID=1917215 RepID=UPI00262B6958|nr:tetratricopeptide repeat protein [Ferrovibrio sp.]
MARSVRYTDPDSHAGSVLGALLLAALLLASLPAHADPRLMAAARGGDAEAAEHLGVMYETGSGVRRNEAEAAYWYGRAAQAGRRQAQYAYAQFLETGAGITRDEKAALEWHLKAACQGHLGAVANIAAMLASGRGTAMDRLSAYRLLLWAKEQRGQDSRKPQIQASLDAIGAGLRARERKAATPLDPSALQTRLMPGRPLAQR